METHTQNSIDESYDELEIERADQRLVEAREEQALVRGDVPPEQVEARIKQMSRRSFLWGALAVGATVGGVRWVGSRRAEDGAVWPLRRGLENNEAFWRDVSGQMKLAPTFPAHRARKIRANGDAGLDGDFDLVNWQLNIEGLDNAPASVTLADIKKLSKVTMTTELKCIEGWATVVTWSGARLSDFVRQYTAKPDELPEYVGLMTPDGGYYVGLEKAAALHPQTLLCYEMNGKPLTLEHGAPLRLATPIKYGIKNLKRIGTIAFTGVRPADYWAERGYDYYAGF